MKSKQLKIAGIVTVASYLLVICLYFIHQGNKSHPDARQAESYVHQLSDNKYDSVRNDLLISERTAIKIADRLFQKSTESGILFFGNHLISIYLTTIGLFMRLFLNQR